jgi:hypothetical protein
MPAVAQNARHCQRSAPTPAATPAATTPAPVQNLEVRSMQEIVEAIRFWRDERGITLEQLDFISGWAQGYGAKLLCDPPIKNLGWSSLGLGLNALAIKLVVVEDPEQRKIVEGRWQRRERPRNAPSASAPGQTNRHQRVTSRR